jgi:prevent-host-death family protein
MTMKTVTENALKDRMSDYLREVEATGEELMVTKDGQLVLKIISYNRYSGELESNREEHNNSW